MSRSEKILVVMIIATVVFIWGQSVLPVSASQKESSSITENVVHPIEEAITGKKATITDNTVRKFAHGIEYAVLGFEMLLLLKKRKTFRAVGYCMCISFLDESIQMLTDRGEQIQDMWIDLLGVLIGVLLAYAVFAIIAHRQKSKKIKLR